MVQSGCGPEHHPYEAERVRLKSLSVNPASEPEQRSWPGLLCTDEPVYLSNHNLYPMKITVVPVLLTCLFFSCNSTEKANETDKSPMDVSGEIATVAAAAPEPNCKTLAGLPELGKDKVYQESAKPIKVTLTMNEDTSSTNTPKGCYHNYVATIEAAKKSGDRVFKRTFTKDDLCYFGPSDETLDQSVLQNVTYKPSFNAQKYINLTARLEEPISGKRTDYLVYMNYFGEVIKVK